MKAVTSHGLLTANAFGPGRGVNRRPPGLPVDTRIRDAAASTEQFCPPFFHVPEPMACLQRAIGYSYWAALVTMTRWATDADTVRAL